MVLKLYNAREVDAGSAPQLYQTVRELADRAGLPMPKVFLIDEAQPNAFATGRNPEHASIAATTGILRLLSLRELRGVLAHELAHVKHRDILTSTITASIAGAISTLAHSACSSAARDDEHRNPILAILVLILAPIAAVLIQLAISAAVANRGRSGRRRYFRVIREPSPTRWRIDRYARGVPLETAEEHPATAQMMIVNPLHGGGIAGLFSTHPPTEERIDRLLALAA
jgi:heat shock protein HtpX